MQQTTTNKPNNQTTQSKLNTSIAQSQLNTTTTSQSKQLSKQHLINLFSTKKIKGAKQYISQLKNSNPKAQKIINQSLQQIFCHKNIPSATTYMYALVFYKNLLISGQMDYYQDQQFFNIQIHQAIAQICQYNSKQSNISQRGKDYFGYAIKIQPKQSEDLQSTGKAVVVFALQLLQTMGQLYKQSYLTGQQSFFTKKYNQLIKKGIAFPKKQQYLYIKQQDKKQFQQNYLQLLEQGLQEQQGQQKNNQKQQSKKIDQQVKINMIIVDKKQQSKTMQNSKEQNKKQQQLKKSINQIKPTINSNKRQQQKPLSAGISSILKQVQQKKSKQQLHQQSSLLLNNQKQQQQQKSTVRNQKSQLKIKQINKSKQQTIPLNNQKKQQNADYKQTSRKQFNSILNKNNILNTKIQQKQIISQQLLCYQNSAQNHHNNLSPTTSLSKNNIQQQNKKIQPFNNNNKIQPSKSHKNQSINNHKQISSSSLSKKSLKRTQFLNPNDNKTPQKYQYQQENLPFDHIQLPIQSKSKQLIIEKPHLKHKHKIFQQIKPKSTNNQLKPIIQPNIPQNKPYLQQNSTLRQQTINQSIVSFSPNPTSILNIIRQSPLRSQKKSVPKTQKKHLQKTFSDNYQELVSKLNSTQKQFGKNNKKSYDKFPMKTLSAWRCQKHVKRQFLPSISQPQILEQLWSTVKSKRIPFVPQYFHPTTLKMSGLRRAALQHYQFTSSSQIFFNNNVISARLMKPSENYFILSLVNVSGKDMMIKIYEKKGKQNNESSIKFVDQNDKKKRILREGAFMDVRFVFMTNDLNFKFLNVDFQINDNILLLQMPVTLLDSCKVTKNVDINEVSSLIRRSGGKVFNSQPFTLNLNDLPKFLQTSSQIDKIINRTQTFIFPVTYFTIKLSQKSQLNDIVQQNVLLCRISETQNIKGRYQLSILLNSQNEETQNFAKVMIELLVFLLSQ